MTDLERALEEAGVHRRFAVDILSVVRGLRGLGLIHAPLGAEPALQAALSGAGLRVFARRALVRRDDPDSREGVLREPRGDEDANFVELWYAPGEASALPPPDALFAEPGQFLGYPACCVAEWERLKSQRDLYRRYLFEATPGHWEINRLAALFQGGLLLPDFFPCSLACEQARAFALPILAAVEEVLDPAWVRATARWMRAPVVHHSGALYAFPEWRLAGPRLELSLASAAKTPLAAVAQLDAVPRPGLRLVPFRHLAAAEEAVLVAPDGTAVTAALEQGGA